MSYDLRIVIVLILFIIAEVYRREGGDGKTIVVEQIIAALPLVAWIIMFIVGTIYKFI